jgi:serine/threonine protein kinase
MIIANKYKIVGKLGSGTYGDIYKAENIRTKAVVAIKMESCDVQTKMLKRETTIYQYLNNTEGIPKVLWFGMYNNNYYMAMNILGQSLRDIIESNSLLSLDNVLLLGIQMVRRLESIHSLGLIHRDVKPDNFLFGCNDKTDILYLIDFGLCKKYVDGENHIIERKGRKLIGTPNYVSINVHNGVEASRRDDLESVVYIMSYLLYGKLVWFEYFNKDDNLMNETICKMKAQFMENTNIPIQLRMFFGYCREIPFSSTPNYEYICRILNKKIE